MNHADAWVPRSVACRLIGEGLGERGPISKFRLMRLIETHGIRVRSFGTRKLPRYYVSRRSIERLLASDDGVVSL